MIRYDMIRYDMIRYDTISIDHLTMRSGLFNSIMWGFVVAEAAITGPSLHHHRTITVIRYDSTAPH